MMITDDDLASAFTIFYLKIGLSQAAHAYRIPRISAIPKSKFTFTRAARHIARLDSFKSTIA